MTGRTSPPTKTLHIAPMLDVSTREFRALMRILSKRAVLWTEMVVDETVAHSADSDVHLGYDPETRPLVLQIGGSSPRMCALGAAAASRYGYDGVDLNCDCPSDRVSGLRGFGAALMGRPDVAAAVVRSMSESAGVATPVSVKTRIGLNDRDTFEFLSEFVRELSAAQRPRQRPRFVIHARKAILGGLSPAQNRRVPPLNYRRVYDLCEAFPDCDFVINGGINGLREAKRIAYGTEYCRVRPVGSHHVFDHDVNGRRRPETSSGDETERVADLKEHDVPCDVCKAPYGSCVAPPVVAPPNLRGCMLGRAAMDNPSLFWDVDRYFYEEASNPCRNRREVLLKYCDYLERIYPGRCRDNDDRVTFRIPAPCVTRVRNFCDVCEETYKAAPTKNVADVDHAGERESARSLPGAGFSNNPSESFRRKHQRNCPGAKISSRVIDRALKPISGIFFGLPSSKAFRRACDKLSRDLRVRNCGPGFIVRKAIEIVPCALLDQDFIKNEDNLAFV